MKRLNKQFLFFDGGTGTMLQKMGLKPGEMPETWNVTRPQDIVSLHEAYIKAGADIICTNTFGASPIKLGEEYEKYVRAGVTNARRAVCGTNCKVALDIGPSGKLLKPYGDLDFEEAVACFSGIVRAGKDADLILIETMNDSYEAKAAVLAAKENSDLPVFVTCVFDQSKKLMTGASPAAMVALLEGLGVDALGVNCSLGPKEMKPVIKELVGLSSVPILVNPNAGLPQMKNGETVYGITPEDFAEEMTEIANMGAVLLGGCCGTTPAHIAEMKKRVLENASFRPVEKKNITMVSSYTNAVVIGKHPVLIGERINPTGKTRLKAALREENIEYIQAEGIGQQEKGAHILDVNVGLPEICEADMMEKVVSALQSVCDLPLQIDTASPTVMEKGMRVYNGKPMVNSVSGKQESMHKVFPLVKKYGGVVVALTLDEQGIPNTYEGRLAIAHKIYQTAQQYGIEKKNIIVDALAMTISADTTYAITTLQTLNGIRKEGGNTILGVSNISFGLPEREAVNSTFFALALENGLSAAIMNPYSQDMRRVFYSYCALKNMDDNCEQYIAFSKEQTQNEKEKPEASDPAYTESLQEAICKGLKAGALAQTQKLLENHSAMEIIQEHIIPALDKVGKGFENKTVFLPQLLISAETAKVAFTLVKQKLSQEADHENKSKRGKIIIATVEGDIHDIGKNIVKVLLENYGFDVLDLGKDVKAEEIVQAVKTHHVKLVGLSALMTTTVPAMEKTISLLHRKCPGVKTVVGGAVLTEEYASMIRADKYAGDAMETVRYAEQIIG